MPSNKATSNISEDDVQAWGLEDVSNWLRSIKLDVCIEEFKSLQIDGQRLLLVTWDEFKTLESLKDEKKKKLLKKGLANLPGRGSASSKTKKKLGKKATKGGGVTPPPPRPTSQSFAQPVGGYPPDNASVPSLPPRPSKPGSYPPPPTRPLPSTSPQPPSLPPTQSRPPPIPNVPRPPNMRPPVNSGGGYNFHQPQSEEEALYAGEEDENEDIYDAVNPDEEIEEETEDIYDDGEDSFDDDDVEEEYEESASFQQPQPNKDMLFLKAKFYAHGIGTLEGRRSYIEQQGDPIDEEIYDLPPEGEQFTPAPPPLPPGAPPPPPPGAPPPNDSEFIDEDIYDLPPEQEEMSNFKPHPPGAPPTGDEFGYDEDIYDIADSDEIQPQSQPPPSIQNMPRPGFIRPPMRPIGGQAPPPQGPPPPLQGMPRPPLRPPLPTEDIGGEEIYDCMEAEEEETPPVGIRPPPMRAPLDASPPTSKPLLRPPINQPINDIQKVKLNSAAHQPPPPLPSSSSKPLKNLQEIQQAKLSATAGQAPPMRPPSSSKNSSGTTPAPPPPPPPPPPSSQATPTNKEDSDDESGSGGGLASELAAMKKRLRAGSNASPSSSPPIEKKTIPTNVQSSRPSPTPPRGGGGGDLASSIAQARMRLRTGTKLDEQPNAETPTTKINLPNKQKEAEPVVKKATPPSSPKPFRAPKPQPQATKPQTKQKPALAPKSNKVTSLMKSFQQNEPSSVPPSVLRQPKDAVELDRSPMTGRKMDRKQSVKELTERYSQSDEELSPKHEAPPNVPRPSDGPNAAMNVFKRKQLEAESEGPPPVLPSKPSFNKAPPPTPPTSEPHLPPKKPFEGQPPRSPIAPKKDMPRPPTPPKNVPEKPHSVKSDVPPLPGKQHEAPPLPGRPLPQPTENPPLPGRPVPQPTGAPPLPGRPLPPANETPPLPGRPVPQPANAPPLPGRPLPQPTEAPPLPGRPLPQPTEAPPLPGRPLPQPTEAPSLPGRPLPQPTEAPSLPGRPLPQPTEAPPLPGRPLPQPTEGPPLPGRPQAASFNKPPIRPPMNEEPPLPARPSSSGSPRGQSWYHAALDRKNAEIKIKRYQKDGTFIIRDNTRTPGEYSLSLWFDGGIRHLRIRKRGDGQFVLGEEKPDEVPFTNVVDLVSFYKTEPVVLKSGGQTPLKYECPQ